MAKKISKQGGLSVFEQIKQIDENGNEFWTARIMAKVLEYSEYRHFSPVIERAKEACQSSGQQIADHFEDILEMVQLGDGHFRKAEKTDAALCCAVLCCDLA